MTTVHNFTINVTEIIVRYLFVLGQIVVEHITANLEITIIKIVVTRPSLAAELLTTKDKRVEHAKTEEHSLELAELMRLSLLEVRLVEHVEGTTNVCFKICGGLVGNLN